MNCLLASELCLWSVPCFERMHSASKEQMSVLSDVKDVLIWRHTCHHSYQEVLLRMFSVRLHLCTQHCARHMQNSMQNILPGWKKLLANKTQSDSKPVKMTSFPRLHSDLKVSQCLIRMRTALFSSFTHPWLKNPGAFFNQLSQCVESEAFLKQCFSPIRKILPNKKIRTFWFLSCHQDLYITMYWLQK